MQQIKVDKKFGMYKNLIVSTFKKAYQKNVTLAYSTFVIQ